MRRYIILIIFISCSHFVLGQNVAVEETMNHGLIVGAENPLSIAVEGYLGRNLLVSTDNGVVKKESPRFATDYNYLVIPAHAGKLTLTIRANLPKQKKVICKKEFRVYCGVPKNTQAKLFGKFGGAVSRTQLDNPLGPWVYIEDMDCTSGIYISSFTVIVHKKGIEVFRKTLNRETSSAYIKDDEETMKALKMMTPGDTLNMTDIECKNFNTKGCSMSLPPLEFVVVE